MRSWMDDNMDYRSMGFRCGVEIHQQLDTAKKLFCHCPVGLTSAPPDAYILRRMRPTLSEMGEYDGTALMEKKTRKEIIYEMFNDRVCTYEMDDTPPFLVNQEALEIGIRLSLLFQCKIVDEAHVARKQYLDGSIPTGFQRTILLGTDGWVPYRGRRIRIAQINIEEDACREVSDQGHRIRFRTDRLSTPLVEVITEAQILDPTEAGEVTRLLAETNRISGLVRRGIGTARQDVNVSITGGTRVEIKGVEKISLIPALTHFEALRQKSLLKLRDELARRGLSAPDVSCRTADVTRLMAASARFTGRPAIDRGGAVGSVCITGFRGLPDFSLFPGKTFSDELSGRVRVIACLDDMPNLAHDGSRAVLGISEGEWRSVRDAISAADDDAAVIVWGPPEDVETALSEIAARCREAAQGVPGETRQVMRNGWSTDFERILPGPDRMYPDTDHPPIRIDEERVANARLQVPEFPWKRRERLCELGLSGQLVDELLLHPRFYAFEKMAEASADPVWAAVTTVETLKHLKRTGCDVSNIADGQLIELARLFRAGRFYRESTLEIIKRMCEAQTTVDDAVGGAVPKVFGAEIDELIVEAVKEDGGPKGPDKRRAYLMDRVMRKHRGQVSGSLLWQKISKL